MFGLHYRFHLQWIYSRHRFGLNKIISFQNRQMPYVPVPTTWVRHNFGGMELSLPSEFHISESHTNNIAVHQLYQCEGKSLFISFPDEYRSTFAMVTTEFNICPRHSISTLPMLRYECYRTASTEFCWSMSPSEVQWYLYCAMFTKAYQIMQDGGIELLTHDTIDGILMLNRNKAVFEWQCKRSFLGGYIHFHNGDETDLNDVDNDWIRAVSWSLKIRGI